jgi:hypothetical protein
MDDERRDRLWPIEADEDWGNAYSSLRLRFVQALSRRLRHSMNDLSWSRQAICENGIATANVVHDEV